MFDCRLSADQFIAMLVMKDILKADPETGEIFKKDKKGGWKHCCGTITRDGYKRINIAYKGFRKNLRAHRIVWIACNGIPIAPKNVVDHQNYCKLDNRLANLRAVTNEDNSARKPPKREYRKAAKFNTILGFCC